MTFCQNMGRINYPDSKVWGSCSRVSKTMVTRSASERGQGALRRRVVFVSAVFEHVAPVDADVLVLAACHLSDCLAVFIPS